MLQQLALCHNSVCINLTFITVCIYKKIYFDLFFVFCVPILQPRVFVCCNKSCACVRVSVCVILFSAAARVRAVEKGEGGSITLSGGGGGGGGGGGRTRQWNLLSPCGLLSTLSSRLSLSSSLRRLCAQDSCCWYPLCAYVHLTTAARTRWGKMYGKPTGTISLISKSVKIKKGESFPQT